MPKKEKGKKKKVEKRKRKKEERKKRTSFESAKAFGHFHCDFWPVF